MGLVGNGWANCFRTHNELTMGLPGKYPLTPSACKFIKFSTDEERDAHIREHEAAIKSGAMVLIPKKSKAKGKGKAKQSEVIDDEDGELMDTA